MTSPGCLRRRTLLALALALLTPAGCARPLPAHPAQRDPLAHCTTILATIPYTLQPATPALTLAEDDAAELAEWIARLRGDPELRLEIAVHMDRATRSELAAADVEALLRRLGDDALARFRSDLVPPSRAALVIHGVPGGPVEEPLAGPWLQLRRPCGPLAEDRDEDGIADAGDRCIDIPEDHDRFEDGDGCPDPDNDGDGVLDAHAWTGTQWTNCDGKIEKGGRRLDCRDQPETVNSEQDEDGCPEFLISDCGSFVVRIAYDPATEQFDEEGLLELEARRRHLAARLQTGGVFRIEGHTASDRPKSAATQLSLTMAEKVRDALLRRGFAHKQLTARGRGFDAPIADDDTPEGRRANHRVEVVADLSCTTPSQPLCP